MVQSPTALAKKIVKAITPAELAQVLPYARRKMELINERYGTDHGEEYLWGLVVESVRLRRLSLYLEERNAKRRAARSDPPS